MKASMSSVIVYRSKPFLPAIHILNRFIRFSPFRMRAQVAVFLLGRVVFILMQILREVKCFVCVPPSVDFRFFTSAEAV